jgi:hypothetical protein
VAEQSLNPSVSLAVATPWQEIRRALGIREANPHEPEPVAVAGEAALKAEILRLWEQATQSKKTLSKGLYELQKLLHNPGKKDVGFDSWLKQSGIPKSTAYWLIKKYCQREGLADAIGKKKSKVTPKPIPASSNIGQAGAEKHAEFIPAPTTIPEVTGLLARFFETLPDIGARSQCVIEIRQWLDSIAVTNGGKQGDSHGDA